MIASRFFSRSDLYTIREAEMLHRKQKKSEKTQTGTAAPGRRRSALRKALPFRRPHEIVRCLFLKYYITTEYNLQYGTAREGRGRAGTCFHTGEARSRLGMEIAPELIFTRQSRL